MIILVLVLVLVIMGSWVVARYNSMQRGLIDVKTQWAQVETVYQTRYDLVPNLVNTVKGAANFEKTTLTQITEARAKTGGVMQMTPEMLNDPNAFARFQEAQAGLGAALQRLMVVVERYPELKANQNYLNLQEQLEGIENRIRQERRMYNETAGTFNKMVITFPNRILAGIFNIQTVALFKAEEQAQQAPIVQFE